MALAALTFKHLDFERVSLQPLDRDEHHASIISDRKPSELEASSSLTPGKFILFLGSENHLGASWAKASEDMNIR